MSVLALSLIGTAISAVGQIAAGKAQASADEYQAQIALRNAKIQDENAQRALKRTQIEAQTEDLRAAAILGEQTATQGASGLSISSGSFRRVRKSTRKVGRLSSLNIIQGGEIEAFNSRVDAANFRANAEGYQASARNAKSVSYFGAATSLIGGATSFRRSSRFANSAPRAVPLSRILR